MASHTPISRVSEKVGWEWVYCDSCGGRLLRVPDGGGYDIKCYHTNRQTRKKCGRMNVRDSVK